MSLKRVGWQFVTPLVLRTAEGLELSLTTHSPALIAYHLQVAWRRLTGVRAGVTAGAEPGAQMDATTSQKAMRDLPPHHKTLVRAYMTQAVWSNSRLYSCGYDVLPTCIHCGARRDTLYHRIWECGYTEDLRKSHFTDSDLQWIRDHPRAHELLQGLQVLPYLPDDRPNGMGHERGANGQGRNNVEEYTITGAPLEDFLHGRVHGRVLLQARTRHVESSELGRFKAVGRRRSLGLGQRPSRAAPSFYLPCV